MLDEPSADSHESRAAQLLWVLLGAFFLRVAGQALVVVAHPTWLPPMGQWYSGLVPYPLLLPIQILLLGGMTAIAANRSRRQAASARPRPSLGRRLTVASYLYAGAMVVRYVVRMWLMPDQRWLGGTIPIAFHLVLATFLYVWARGIGGGGRHGVIPQERR